MYNLLLNIDFNNSKFNYNALLKPREDISKILNKQNYKVINIGYKTYLNYLKKNLIFIYNLLTSIIKNPPKKIKNLVMQYPIGSIKRFKIFSYILKIYNHSNKIVIIHDIPSLRFKNEISKEELNVLNLADIIIVHTNSMKNLLLSKGIYTKIKILNLFDYLAKGNLEHELNYDKSIVFAGNLEKSKFLKLIDQTNFRNNLYLYGSPIDYIWPANLKYIGKFKPDEINNIQGSWGLVWDGDSVDTCNGPLGHYLLYNSPHKASLYIAAGKPIIVWEESAIAQFVKENNLGITISSLNDIEKKIDKLSIEDLNHIREGVSKFQKLIRKGEMINLAIN